MAWGMRVIESSDIYMHGMGLYSWFQNYTQDCVANEDCQDQILQVQGSTKNIAMFNIFSKASIAVASGAKRYVYRVATGDSLALLGKG
jgi:hypothetical protein